MTASDCRGVELTTAMCILHSKINRHHISGISFQCFVSTEKKNTTFMKIYQRGAVIVTSTHKIHPKTP